MRLDKIKEYFEQVRKNAIPHLVSTTVVFTYQDEQLKTLLLEVPYLNGVLQILQRAIFNDESVEESAKISLEEVFGLKNYQLRQFHSFDISEKQRKQELEVFLGKINSKLRSLVLNKMTAEDLELIQQRLIMITHYALVNKEDISTTKSTLIAPIDNLKWYNINEINDLPLEQFQKEVIFMALNELKKNIAYSPAMQYLLPKQFTVPELQKLIELIVGEEMDRANFRKKILKMGALIQVGKKASNTHRSPFLYEFNGNYFIENNRKLV